ncbi:uncharacterized protein STAUR_5527 [Stigmatella aurantiaca DW4/3-1]|uniref:Uncharacterized protein n=1 Tax=Stigmatella aurantiaca (strain DW4/3-1) TaxID=378806 RepID=E3FR78_STIAD|nr:uncharacterized protein STAUR_5527 [Stigmatella aurantiaca DW4/3-1]
MPPPATLVKVRELEPLTSTVVPFGAYTRGSQRLEDSSERAPHAVRESHQTEAGSLRFEVPSIQCMRHHGC